MEKTAKEYLELSQKCWGKETKSAMLKILKEVNENLLDHVEPASVQDMLIINFLFTEYVKAMAIEIVALMARLPGETIKHEFATFTKIEARNNEQ